MNDKEIVKVPASLDELLNDEDDDGDDEFDVTAELSSRLLAAIPSDDPFDAPKFDPVEYINEKFPDEKSLDQAEETILNLQNAMSSLEANIIDTVRIQANQGQKCRLDLQDVQESIDFLFTRMASMKSKAAESEQLVVEICKDIQSLNNAKINLSATIGALKRIVIFVTALEQLSDFSAKRMYRKAADLVFATRELSTQFEQLKEAPKIAELLAEKERLLLNLREQILEDFAAIFDPNEDPADSLRDACLAADSISPKLRYEIISNFCGKLLEVYKKLFSPGTEAAGLESVKRRYTWLKRSQTDFNTKYAKCFIPSWNVSCVFAEHFCRVTREQLVELLSSSAHTTEPKLLVQALRQSIELETSLNNRFNAEEGITNSALGTGPNKEEAVSEGDDSSEVQNRSTHFKGLISECFEVYLGPWVRSEEQILMDLVNKSLSDDQPIEKMEESQLANSTEDLESDEEPRVCVYKSAFELFAAFKTCVARTCLISTRQTLFEMFQTFRRVLKKYVESFLTRIKKGVLAMKEEDAISICCILGTAEYCDATLPLLASTILRDIEDPYRKKITFEGETELLWSLKTAAVQHTVGGLEAALEPSWQKMSKSNWVSIMGRENSPFIVEVERLLRSVLPWLINRLSASHYRFLCDKIAQYIIPKFITSIFACKKIGEMGAQQLLTDAKTLKPFLLELPVLNNPAKSVPSGYKKFVTREMGKVFAMLMVLIAPEMDALGYKALLEENGVTGSTEDFPKILALKSTSYSAGMETIYETGHNPSSLMLGTRDLSGGLQVFSGAIKKESMKAAEDMRNFLNLFSKSRTTGSTISDSSHA